MQEKIARHAAMYRYLVVLTIAATAGLQIWRTLFNNFAVEAAGLNGSQVGILQSIREIPGFLALLAVYVMLMIREHRLSALSLLLLGLGVTATGILPSFSGLILTTLVMSFGFHYFETTNQSLTLQYFDQKTSPWVFGERKVLSLEYASLIFIFVAYAYVSSKWMVALLYILDHLFFNFAIAIRTYFQKVGDPKDIAPSMAVGFTINHIAAVVLPVLGGLVWMIDYRLVFFGGAAMSLISLIAVQKIRTPTV